MRSKDKKKPELLAPAGDLERLKWAIWYGADAVYLGGIQFGLRANATNFNKEELEMGVKYAHENHVRVYVTVNIALHNQELKEVKAYLEWLNEIGVDAIIISDPAIIPIVKSSTSLEIHLSTQQSTLNIEAARFWKEAGVTRIVMAREATEEDIIAIKENVDIEIECFIHGAMCASFSGRCVLSNFLTMRDANRGGCSQICRWDFNLFDREEKKISGDKPFTFCSKDLQMSSKIPIFCESGIDSFKIEGRMRSIYYLATVLSVYRHIIDDYWKQKGSYEYNENDERVLRNCANRDSIPQFFDGVMDESYSYYNGRIEVSNQAFLGVIKSYEEGTKCAIVEERNYFAPGDIVEIFGPTTESFSFTIESIRSENGEVLDAARHPFEKVMIEIPCKVKENDLMRLKN